MAIAPSANDSGYLLVGADGGTFSFGSGAPYAGSLPGEGVSVDDVIGVALTPNGPGYWMAEASGSVWSFGTPGPCEFRHPRPTSSSPPSLGVSPRAWPTARPGVSDRLPVEWGKSRRPG